MVKVPSNDLHNQIASLLFIYVMTFQLTRSPESSKDNAFHIVFYVPTSKSGANLLKLISIIRGGGPMGNNEIGKCLQVVTTFS